MCLSLSAAVVLAGCRERGPSPSVGSGSALAGRTAGCNVVVITMDTTRADRLGCYGWSEASTPVLDSLARSGVRFERAYTQVPITLPSHIVLMTGRYPAEFGVRVNFRRSLGQELPTLAELARERGYRTGAFVGAAVLDSRYGLDRGFEVYEDKIEQTNSFPLQSQIPGDMVCDRTLAWLRRVKEEPFFCWMHLFDPHTPHTPPVEYLEKTRDAYDGEIAFMDANIGRLIQWLSSNALIRKTLVVAVGDHGESLGERGHQWHALLLYDSILRVPLIFSLPGRLPENAVRGGVVGLVDIMPTILELMGWRAPAGVSGASFIAELDGSSVSGGASYGETDYPYDSFGWSKLRCLVEGRWKYIRAPVVELYDLSADPHETQNQATVETETARSMEQKLAALEAGMREGRSAPAAMDRQAVEALRSLGYVSAGVESSQAPRQLKNPVEMVGIERAYRWAEDLLGGSRFQEAIELLEPAAAQSPESFVVMKLLGKAYALAGRLEESQRQLMEAIALYPDSADGYAELAATLALRKRFERCVEACRTALTLDPANQWAQEMLTAAGADLSKQRAEIESVRSAVRVNPEAVEPRIRLANLLTESGRAMRAIEVLRAGLAVQADEPRLAGVLAWLLATSGQSDALDGGEAVTLARRYCESAGEQDVGCLDTLAAAYAESGQFEDAVQTARRAVELAPGAGDQNLAIAIRGRLAMYEAGRPYHQLP